MKKRRFIQWALSSALAAIVSLVGLVVNGERLFPVFEPLLDPWIVLCRAITPDSWQTMGNIPLALAWIGSGIVVYSGVLGALLTLLLAMIEKRRQQSPEKTARPATPWWPFCLAAVGIALVAVILLIMSASSPIVPKEPPGKDMLTPEIPGDGEEQGAPAPGTGRKVGGSRIDPK